VQTIEEKIKNCKSKIVKNYLSLFNFLQFRFCISSIYKDFHTERA